MQCTAFSAYVETGAAEDPYYNYGYKRVDSEGNPVPEGAGAWNQYVQLERRLFPMPSKRLYELQCKD